MVLLMSLCWLQRSLELLVARFVLMPGCSVGHGILQPCVPGFRASPISGTNDASYWHPPDDACSITEAADSNCCLVPFSAVS